VNVRLQSAQVLLEHVHLGDRDLFLHAELFTNFVDGIHVFKFVQVGNITTIQDVIDVLKLLLLDDLGIDEQERSLFVFATSHHEGLLDIFTPVGHRVALNDFDLEKLVVGTEGSETSQ
jgi:hypothetical protein